MAGEEHSTGVDNFTNNTRMVKVTLPNNTAFVVHAKDLADASPHLKILIDTADPSRSMEFITIAADLMWCAKFNEYVKWIYKGRFTAEHYPRSPPNVSNLPPVDTFARRLPKWPLGTPFTLREHVPLRSQNTGSAIEPDYEHLKALYLLGIELEDLSFQDAVLDAFLSRVYEPVQSGISAIPSNVVVNDIYYGTRAECKARFLLVEIFASKAVPYEIETVRYHPEFVRNFALKMMRERRPTPIEAGKCAFHTHAANEACTGRKRKRT